MATKAPKDWIEKYADPTRAADAYDKQRVIASLLDTGPVLIGENHQQDEARAVIANLISHGKVKHLIIEVTDRWSSTIKKLEEKFVQLGSKEFGKEAKLAFDADKNSFDCMDYVKTSMFKGDQIKIHFGLLVYRALKYDCKVYPADKHTDYPTKSSALKIRNDYAARKLLELNQAGYSANVVVLFGADHFSPFVEEKKKEKRVPFTIDVLAKVPTERVVIFPKRA